MYVTCNDLRGYVEPNVEGVCHSPWHDQVSHSETCKQTNKQKQEWAHRMSRPFGSPLAQWMKDILDVWCIQPLLPWLWSEKINPISTEIDTDLQLD